MSDYNGWTNYATWRVNLEIFDGYDPYDAGHDSSTSAYDLGLSLKDIAEELLANDTNEESLAYSYAMAFFVRRELDRNRAAYDRELRRGAMRMTYESTIELAKIHHYKEAPDGSGYFKVTHITPDKCNIGNDSFYFYYEAWVYAKDLKAKGYHDITITGA